MATYSFDRSQVQKSAEAEPAMQVDRDDDILPREHLLGQFFGKVDERSCGRRIGTSPKLISTRAGSNVIPD